MIAQDVLNTILSASDIVEVINDFVKLQKKGINYIGNCPFHNEKTASLVVSPTKKIYKCFGCGAGGNAINFVKEHEKISYPAAARYVADKYNIIFNQKETNAELAEYGQRDRLKNINKWASDFFNSNCDEASEYFKKRQISDEIIVEFELGFAKDGWNFL